MSFRYVSKTDCHEVPVTGSKIKVKECRKGMAFYQYLSRHFR
jgi:hypothetical protein